MDTQTFNAYLETLFEASRKVLAKKAEEYAPDVPQASRFHNFEVAARLNDQTPEQALWGFATKHIISLRDMIQSDDPTEYDAALWDEKIGDSINYLLLLSAMLKARRDLDELKNSLTTPQSFLSGLTSMDDSSL